jgi:hypothetical protein
MCCAAAALPDAGDPAQPSVNATQLVNVGVYVMDFNRFEVGAGSVGVDFYLTLDSDFPVAIDDLDLINGQINSVTTIRDSPLSKEYRVIAVLVSEPDLSRYPFDRHTLVIKLEPRNKTEKEMLLAIGTAETGLYKDADLPGRQFTRTRAYTTNESYIPGETPYSRAVFTFGIERDTISTILKFFLPLMLIVIVSLSSLLMKVSSRLGLNASMFLAAVLIHWRIADAIPLVSYATFLDLFMIITYATLVMVLISGILVLKYSEEGDTGCVKRINYWSLRIIPPLTIGLYLLLFLVFLV